MMSRSCLKWVLLLTLVHLCLSIPYKMKVNRPIHNQVHQKQAIEQSNKNLQAITNNQSNILWPLPKSLQLNPNATDLVVSPCRINYKIYSPSNPIVQEIIDFYLTQVFSCTQQQKENITLTVIVGNTDQMVATNVSQEKYSLIIRESNTWELYADYYVGFLRGFETFSQLFEESTSDDGSKTQYVVRGIPIVIDDQPDYAWRGLMIDCSRHFQPIKTLKKMIDGLMFNKMNILHLHLTDQDSFTMEIKAQPELSQFGSVGGTYSESDIKSLIQYAKTRGVRLVPEIDSPAHTQSWGRSPKYSEIVVKCNTAYDGQFDPTVNLTYEVVKNVMQYIDTAFIDEYVHFGGDQVRMECWDERPEIKERMKALKISDYKSLEIYYRQQQKKLWRQINPTKKAIYWANEEIDSPVESDDVIQWWGQSTSIDQLKNRKNEVILSYYDLAYLDVGFGDEIGDTYGVYQNWRSLYTKMNTKVEGVNVIGGEVCIWSQTTSPHNIETKIWIRASALAEKLWNSNISIDSQLRNIATRLYAQSQRMRNRGYKVSPVTVGLCQKDMSLCF